MLESAEQHIMQHDLYTLHALHHDEQKQPTARVAREQQPINRPQPRASGETRTQQDVQELCITARAEHACGSSQSTLR